MTYHPSSKDDTNTHWQFIIHHYSVSSSLRPRQFLCPRPSSPTLAVVFNMPSTRPITPEMKAALLECFQSATRLLPLRLRSSFVLIGGAASVFHGSKKRTEDVDVAASSEAVIHIHGTIESGATQFRCGGPSQPIEFHCSQNFVVHLELLQFGGGYVDSIAVCEPFHDGFIASRADLLALRGVTVADRGKPGDLVDFKFLLKATAEEGSLLP
jgi:hypothetical protein